MTDAFSLKSTKRVLITGASRGIGASMARLLAKDGHRVVINYYGNHGAAKEVVESIQSTGGTASAIAFDVGDAAAVTTAYETLQVKTDPFGIIVNNAGVAMDGPFAGMKPEDWKRVLSTSLDGFFNVTQPLTMYLMRARWGRIVNVVSFSGLAGNRGQVNYAAAKAGLIGATKSLAKELAPRNITVNALCPGIIETDMIADLDQKAYLSHVPLARLGQPEEVAQALRFLVSDAAAYITGSVLQVGGGFSG